LPNWSAFESASKSSLLIDDASARAAPIPDAAQLSSIDSLYRAVRLMLKYGVVIAVVVGLLGLALIWWLVSLLLCGRKRIAGAT
jgi:hypothetical protein